MTALSEPIFELRGLSVTRQTAAGNLQVLQDIDLSLQPGQWLALLGPNGSGKSSLLEFLAAGGTACSGSVAIVFQDPDDQLIAATVARELTLGRPGLLPDPWLTEFGLEGLADRNPRHLSAGQKQRLTMAVALAAQPELLLCDEVTSLQDSRQAAWLLDRIDRWRRETGGAVISATQCPREVVRTDRLAVLSQGRIILSGASAQLMERSEVQGLLVDEFVERPADLDRSESIPTARDPVLKLAGVRLDFPAGGGSLAGLDFSLPAGGRLGVTGPSGCGKSTLLASCVGIRPPEAGTVTLNGQVLYQGTRSCLDHGAALLAPQFPEYLFTSATVAGEIRLDPALAVLDPQEVMAAAGLPASLLTRHPHALSSGQCRRLALVLVVLSERPLLLLDEPTAALDRPGRRQILELLERIPSSTAVMIASHDREFLAAAGCPIMELNAIGGFPAGPGGE